MKAVKQISGAIADIFSASKDVVVVTAQEAKEKVPMVIRSVSNSVVAGCAVIEDSVLLADKFVVESFSETDDFNDGLKVRDQIAKSVYGRYSK